MSQIGTQVLGRLVRRTIEYNSRVDDSLEQRVQAWEELNFEMPPAGVAAIVGTIIYFVLLAALYQYTVGHVVATLAMIEEPSSTLVVETKASLSNDEPDATIEKAPLLDVEQTVREVPNKAVTSKIRATVAHITAQGGWTMRWKGMGIGIMYSALRLWVTALVFAVIPNLGSLTHILVAGISAVIVSPVHCIWTHSTITKPVEKLSLRDYTMKYRKQIPWKSLLLPSLWAAVMAEAAIQLIVSFSALVQDLVNGATDYRAVVGSVAVLVVAIASTMFCMLPSLIVLKRVEASLLPEDFDTLVPFDRTFGGRIEPAVVGMSALARMKAARRSLSGKQFRRVLGIYLKATAIMFAFAFVAVQTVMLELYLIMGDALKTLFIAGEAQLQQMIASL